MVWVGCRPSGGEEDVHSSGWAYWSQFFFFNGLVLLNNVLFIYWLRWVLVAVLRLSLVAASGGYSLLGAWASHCSGFSCCGARALGARASVVVAHGLWSAGSVVVAYGLSCSAACGILPDQGSNPCPLRWQED